MSEERSWVYDVRYDAEGLVPCVVQERATGEVLMVAYMNQASLLKTIETAQTWFWSRSRQELWHKGATSGATQTVVSLHLDCDGDTVLALVDTDGGPACHTGARTCFAVGRDMGAHTGGVPMLSALLEVIALRDAERPDGSYTTALLEGGVDRIGKKVGEEATEVVIAAKNAAFGAGTAELAAESADLLYHLAVLWRSVGLDVRDIADVLAHRG